MKSRFLTIFLIYFLFTSLTGFSYGQEERAVGLRGNYWNKIAEVLPKDKSGAPQTLAFKTALVRGMYEGIFLSRHFSEWLPLSAIYYNANINYYDLVSALDEFYVKDENLDIPLVWALQAVIAKSNGQDEAKIQEMLTNMKKSTKALVDKAGKNTEKNIEKSTEKNAESTKKEIESSFPQGFLFQEQIPEGLAYSFASDYIKHLAAIQAISQRRDKLKPDLFPSMGEFRSALNEDMSLEIAEMILLKDYMGKYKKSQSTRIKIAAEQMIAVYDARIDLQKELLALLAKYSNASLSEHAIEVFDKFENSSMLKRSQMTESLIYTSVPVAFCLVDTSAEPYPALQGGEKSEAQYSAQGTPGSCPERSRRISPGGLHFKPDEAKDVIHLQVSASEREQLISRLVEAFGEGIRVEFSGLNSEQRFTPFWLCGMTLYRALSGDLASYFSQIRQMADSVLKEAEQ